ncbi:transcription factor E2F8 isoform X2 [Panthera tigris]|uniref:transcription factor E2F8 isoform X2 n=1 Tax=Panthera tigris TaxID=9694 RepID=UPI001C6F618F|nr:transcription factor E2F8 isoform X2 [Panthera tigris]
MENEKENLFFEPHKRGLMKTPLKESTAANIVLTEIQPDFGPLTTPTKPKELSQGEPWTPTANLKMLISAVSPEIRNRDQKRGLFDSRNGLPEAKDCLHEHLSGDEYEKSQPSRKEKSLGLLCHKFLARYPNYPNPAVNNDICLDEVAEELTKIRRLYDIANVLSSLNLIKKVHVTEERGRKPAFKWTGPEISPNPSGRGQVLPFPHSDLEVKRPSKDNCAKNLFSTRGKPNFTRHPSLIKLVKSIESDRRKINSAPSSPIKTSKAESAQNPAPFPSKMAQLAAICKMQLEEQSSEPSKKAKGQLERCGHCKPMSPLHTPANAELELTAPPLIQPLGVVPLIPSPLSPAVPMILPQAPSGPSYAIYLQPAHAQTVTPPQGLSPTVCPAPSSKATRSKESTDATTEKAANDATKSGASTRPGSLQPVPERPGAKNRDKEPAGERGSKRASMLEDSGSKKKFKEDLKGLDSVSTALFPSGYLIPLTQCSSLGAESILSSKENSSTLSPNHRIYSSPITGVIPVTSSELTAVNFPSFHVTPLKLMVSPTSVAAVPVGNSPALTSSHPIPGQNPSSAIVNFTLQHLGLISPSVQVSASPGAVPVSPRIDPVSVVPENAGTQQGRATRYDSPVPGQNQPSGQSVAATGAQQPVPVTPKGSQSVAESFFRTPGGPMKPMGLSCMDFDGANKTSVGTLFVPQRKLEVSTEDVR